MRNRSAWSSTSPRNEVAEPGVLPAPPVASPPGGPTTGESSSAIGMNSVTVAAPVGERHCVSSTIVPGR